MKLGGWMVMIVSMIIFLEFMGIPTGLSVILNSFGITINSTSGELVNAGLDNSSFWNQIFGASGILILLAAGGAVVVGLFAKSYDTSLVILPLIVIIGGIFIVTFGTIILYVKALDIQWMTMLITTIFGALGVGFIMSCVDYFAGR
jgi:hypothetical protein